MREEERIQERNENRLAYEKWSGAVRIFQALSSVDGELLARSETARKRYSLQSYAQVLAACICLVVLGGAMLVNTQRSKNSVSVDCALPEMAMQLEEARESENEAGKAVNEEESAVTGGAQTFVEAENQDSHAEGMLQASTTILDEEYFRTMDVLGKYVPGDIPSGYTFAGGYREDNENNRRSICLTWNTDADSFAIRIREYADTYEPAGESVTEEYPVFAEADVTLDVIRDYMTEYKEAEDTDVPIRTFAVLCDSGVLVEFRGCNAPEEIWGMLRSMEAWKKE